MTKSLYSSIYTPETLTLNQIFNQTPRPSKYLLQLNKLHKLINSKLSITITIDELYKVLGIEIEHEEIDSHEFNQIRSLLKEAGYLIVPVGTPVKAHIEDTIYITNNYNIMSDPDIVKTQQAIASKKVENLLTSSIKKATEKLYNHSLLMHIFEGLFSITGNDLRANAVQIDKLIVWINNNPLPIGSIPYFKLCINFIQQEALHINELHSEESHLSTPVDDNLIKDIIQHLAQLTFYKETLPLITYHPYCNKISSKSIIFNSSPEKLQKTETDLTKQQTLQKEDVKAQVREFLDILSKLSLKILTTKKSELKNTEQKLIDLLHSFNIIDNQNIKYYWLDDILIFSKIMCENANLYGLQKKSAFLNLLLPYMLDVENDEVCVNHRTTFNSAPRIFTDTFATILKRNNSLHSLPNEQLKIIIQSLTHRIFIDGMINNIPQNEQKYAFSWLIYWYKTLFRETKLCDVEDHALLKMCRNTITLYALNHPDEITKEHMEIINNHPGFALYHHIKIFDIYTKYKTNIEDFKNEIQTHIYYILILKKIYIFNKFNIPAKEIDYIFPIIYNFSVEVLDDITEYFFQIVSTGNAYALRTLFSKNNNEFLNCLDYYDNTFLDNINRYLFNLKYPQTRELKEFFYSSNYNYLLEYINDFIKTMYTSSTKLKGIPNNTLTHQIYEIGLNQFNHPIIKKIREKLINSNCWTNKELQKMFDFGGKNRLDCYDFISNISIFLNVSVIPNINYENHQTPLSAFTNYHFTTEYPFDFPILSRFIQMSRLAVEMAPKNFIYDDLIECFKYHLHELLENVFVYNEENIIFNFYHMGIKASSYDKSLIPKKILQKYKKYYFHYNSKTIESNLPPLFNYAYKVGLNYIQKIIELKQINYVAPNFSSNLRYLQLDTEDLDILENFIKILFENGVYYQETFTNFMHFYSSVNWDIQEYFEDLLEFLKNLSKRKPTKKSYKLNEDKIKQSIADTKKTQDFLIPIFESDEDNADKKIKKASEHEAIHDTTLALDKNANETIVGTIDIDKEAPSDLSDILKPDGSVKGEAIFNTLNEKCQAIIKQLLQLPSFTENDLNRICKQNDMMGDAAVDIINNWSYSAFDAPLIEYDEPMFFDKDLLADIID